MISQKGFVALTFILVMISILSIISGIYYLSFREKSQPTLYSQEKSLNITPANSITPGNKQAVQLEETESKTNDALPTLSKIVPNSGSKGDEIVIYGEGFLPDNDIGLTPKGVKSDEETAYELVSSHDGKTIKFNLPDIYSVCAFSTLGSDEACIAKGIGLIKGEFELKVINKNGISNSLPFEIKK